MWAGLLRCHRLVDTVHKFVHMLKVLRHLCCQNHVNNGLAQCPVAISRKEKEFLLMSLSDRALPFPHPCPHSMTKHCSGAQPLAGTFKVRNSLGMEKWTRSCLSKFLLLCCFYLRKINPVKPTKIYSSVSLCCKTKITPPGMAPM